MTTKCKINYLTFKIRGQIVKVDPDIFYKIINVRHELPYRKYNGDINSVHLSSAGYPIIVRGTKPCRNIHLSRFVMDAKEGRIVDHINRDPLDNRRKNLRIVTKRQNNLNRKLKNGSGFVSVCIRRRKGRDYCIAKFRTASGKDLSFQLPDSPHNRVIAAFARDKFVLQAGEDDFAPLNFPCFRNEPFRSFLLHEDLRSRRSPKYRQNNGNEL